MNYSSKVDEYHQQVHGIEKKDYSGRWKAGFNYVGSRQKKPAVICNLEMSNIMGLLPEATRHCLRDPMPEIADAGR
jgi:hypothetical protein